MSLPIVFRPDARAEFDDAADWYEQRRPGLGATFTEAVDDVLDLVAAQPRMHATVYKDVRKTVVPVFPYIMLYREDQGGLVVVSVFHTSRDPAEWKSRL
jgi:plasmid stabilization system protein ParE